jgi:hypothetical protein
MAVHVYHKAHHSFVNVLQPSMVIVVKIELLQQHHIIHVLKQFVKMVVNVFQLGIVSLFDKNKISQFLDFLKHLFVNVQVVFTVLDVNLVIIACQIHVLIMVFVHKPQQVTFAHVYILILVLIANKVCYYYICFYLFYHCFFY